jgi:methionyl-tRNA formyltransferase
MKLYCMCTLSPGLNILEAIKNRLSGVIGLSEREPSDSISGFMHMEHWCKENGIDFISVADYSLKLEADKAKLLRLDADIIVVNGWQRLIPDWLIRHCRVGAIGIHGSAYGITKGRGRSPQNWALLMGKEAFTVSLFKIDEGVDSGAIIATETVFYTEFDNIKTSYYKVNDCVSEMILQLLDNAPADLQKHSVNQEDFPQYLPQRYPRDGEIDWSRSTNNIHNFVRALTSPYPCAFSFRQNGGKLTVISGFPFSRICKTNDYGKILRIYTGGEFLVSTGDGSYLIDSYTLEGPTVRQGEYLLSVNFTQQLRDIIARHNCRHPDLTIADELLELAGLKGSSQL